MAAAHIKELFEQLKTQYQAPPQGKRCYGPPSFCSGRIPDCFQITNIYHSSSVEPENGNSMFFIVLPKGQKRQPLWRINNRVRECVRQRQFNTPQLPANPGEYIPVQNHSASCNYSGPVVFSSALLPVALQPPNTPKEMELTIKQVRNGRTYLLPTRDWEQDWQQVQHLLDMLTLPSFMNDVHDYDEDRLMLSLSKYADIEEEIVKSFENEPFFLSTHQISMFGKVISVIICLVNCLEPGRKAEERVPGPGQPIFETLRSISSSSGHQITVLGRSDNLSKEILKLVDESILNSVAEAYSILHFNDQLQTPQHIFMELKFPVSAENPSLVKQELDLLPLCLINQEAQDEQQEHLHVQICKRSTEFHFCDDFVGKRCFGKMAETSLQCCKELFEVTDVSLGNDSLFITAFSPLKARITLVLADNVVTFTAQFVDLEPDIHREEDCKEVPSRCKCTEVVKAFLKTIHACSETVQYKCHTVGNWCRASFDSSASNTKPEKDEIGEGACPMEFSASMNDEALLEGESPRQPNIDTAHAQSCRRARPIELLDAFTQTQTWSLGDLGNELPGEAKRRPEMVNLATQTTEVCIEHRDVTDSKSRSPKYSHFESGANYQGAHAKEVARFSHSSPVKWRKNLEERIPCTLNGSSFDYDSQRKFGQDLYEAGQAAKHRQMAEFQRELVQRMAEKADNTRSGSERSSNIDSVHARTENLEDITVTSRESDARSTTNLTRFEECKARSPSPSTKIKDEAKNVDRQVSLNEGADGATALVFNTLQDPADCCRINSENRDLVATNVEKAAPARCGDVENDGAECGSTVFSFEGSKSKFVKSNVPDETPECHVQKNDSTESDQSRPVLKSSEPFARKTDDTTHVTMDSVFSEACDTITKDITQRRTDIDSKTGCEANAEGLVEDGDEELLPRGVSLVAISKEQRQNQSESSADNHPDLTRKSGPAYVHCAGRQDCFDEVDGPAGFPTRNQRSYHHTGTPKKILNEPEDRPCDRTLCDAGMLSGCTYPLTTKSEFHSTDDDKVLTKNTQASTNIRESKHVQEMPADVRPNRQQQQQQEDECNDLIQQQRVYSAADRKITVSEKSTHANSIETQTSAQEKDETLRTDCSVQDVRSDSSAQNCGAVQMWAAQGARPKTKTRAPVHKPRNKKQGLNPNFIQRHSKDEVTSADGLFSARWSSGGSSCASSLWAKSVGDGDPTLHNTSTRAGTKKPGAVGQDGESLEICLTNATVLEPIQSLPLADSALNSTEEKADSPLKLPFDSQVKPFESFSQQLTKQMSDKADPTPGGNMLSFKNADQGTFKEALPDDCSATFPENMLSSFSQQMSMRSLPIMAPSDSLPYQILAPCDTSQLTNSSDYSPGSLEMKISEACALFTKMGREREERERAAKRLVRAREERERREREKKEYQETEKRKLEENKTEQSAKAPVQESPHWMCEHYQRRCKVRFPCCGKFYPCHRCHNNSDECSGPDVKALQATHIQCVVCKNEQEISEDSHTCKNCRTKLSEYFCARCKHYTGVEKHPYHCEQCGICRIHQDRSFHCSVCNVCLDKRLKGKHKCRPDSGHDECCICLEDAFSGCQILPCSHKVHRDCAIAMLKNGVRSCPVCRHPLYTTPAPEPEPESEPEPEPG